LGTGITRSYIDTDEPISSTIEFSIDGLKEYDAMHLDDVIEKRESQVEDALESLAEPIPYSEYFRSKFRKLAREKQRILTSVQLPYYTRYILQISPVEDYKDLAPSLSSVFTDETQSNLWCLEPDYFLSYWGKSFTHLVHPPMEPHYVPDFFLSFKPKSSKRFLDKIYDYSHRVVWGYEIRGQFEQETYSTNVPHSSFLYHWECREKDLIYRDPLAKSYFNITRLHFDAIPLKFLNNITLQKYCFSSHFITRSTISNKFNQWPSRIIYESLIFQEIEGNVFLDWFHFSALIFLFFRRERQIAELTLYGHPTPTEASTPFGFVSPLMYCSRLLNKTEKQTKVEFSTNVMKFGNRQKVNQQFNSSSSQKSSKRFPIVQDNQRLINSELLRLRDYFVNFSQLFFFLPHQQLQFYARNLFAGIDEYAIQFDDRYVYDSALLPFEYDIYPERFHFLGVNKTKT